MANTRTKSIQEQIKSIDVDKVGNKKLLASKNHVSCKSNRLLISRSNLHVGETECRCNHVLVNFQNVSVNAVMAQTFLSGVTNWNTGVCRREMEVFDQMILSPLGKAPLSENEPPGKWPAPPYR